MISQEELALYLLSYDFMILLTGIIATRMTKKPAIVFGLMGLVMAVGLPFLIHIITQ